MIKITNLNFQNQTIENIDVDGERINSLEIKLTKTKFNIVIVKEVSAPWSRGEGFQMKEPAQSTPST